MQASTASFRNATAQSTSANTALLFDSARFSASSHAAGSVVISRQTVQSTAASTLLQGEDSAQFTESIEALSDLPADHAETLFDSLCAEYAFHH